MRDSIWTPQGVIRERRIAISNASVNFTTNGLTAWTILHGIFGMVTAANVGDRVYTIYIRDAATYTKTLLGTITMPASTTRFLNIGQHPPGADFLGSGNTWIELHDRGPHMMPGDYFDVIVAGGFAGDAGYVRLRVRETIAEGNTPIITST